MEKRPGKSPLTLPLQDYEKLSPEDLQKAADAGGVTPEKLKELVSKAVATKEEDAERRAALRADMDSRHHARVEEEGTKAHELRYIPHEVRGVLENMRQSAQNLDLAEKMEKNAYETFEKHPHTDYSFQSFYHAEKIRARQRMYDLRVGKTLDDIIAVVRMELDEKAKKTNIPYLRDAFARVARELKQEFRMSRAGKTATLASYGSAEKFSANAVEGYVKNPRPRRYNDDLDHY